MIAVVPVAALDDLFLLAFVVVALLLLWCWLLVMNFFSLDEKTKNFDSLSQF